MIESTLSDLLKDRKMTHGDFTDHARISQNLKNQVRGEPGWNSMRDIQKEAIEMILHKIARAVAGDPDFHDHWDDISGYAKITSQRLPRPATQESVQYNTQQELADLKGASGIPVAAIGDRKK